MKTTLTIAFEIDDSPYFVEEEGEWFQPNATALAMDQVNRFIRDAFCGEFTEARLDGVLLADKSGNVAEEVKQREGQYANFLQAINENKK